MDCTAVRWVIALGVGLASASPALAQFGVASLSHADGAVTRIHRGAPAATTINVSLMDGDQIETANGRAEVAFLDGTVVHLDRHAKVIVESGDKVQVLDGRVSLRTSGQKNYQVAIAGTKLTVQLGSVIEIVTKADKQDVYLRVINGSARIESPWGGQQVPDYHSAYVAGPASAPFLTKVVPTQADEFERWALARTVLATSTPLKGTEGGGGVAYPGYYPYYYGYYGYYPTYYAYYPVYYARPVYYSPYYYSPYYPSAYYPSSYYSSSYYYVPPSSYYYNGYYSSNYSTQSSYNERYSWPASPARPSSIFAPRPMASPATPPQTTGTIRRR
jgi:hypothetical protein